MPTEERCDGVDEDCDGSVDEGYAVIEACGLGVCLLTATPSSCINGVETACQPGQPRGDDANCDGLDDDCDGEINEGCTPASVEFTVSSVAFEGEHPEGATWSIELTGGESGVVSAGDAPQPGWTWWVDYGFQNTLGP